MNQTTRFELRIENEVEVQEIFDGFFRTMGQQMGPSFSETARRGSFSVSSAIVDKSAELLREGGILFHVDVTASPFWEIDFDREVVTVPVCVEVSKGLLEAIEFFDNAENRVVLPRYRANQS